MRDIPPTQMIDHTSKVPWFLVGERNSLHLDEYEKTCAESLITLSEVIRDNKLSSGPLSHSQDLPDSLWYALKKAKKAKKDKKLKFQRTLNACAEHRRKHQRCPPECAGRLKEQAREHPSSPEQSWSATLPSF
jgi:hypothetical protein